MNTTAIFVELLIAGIQASVWIMLLIFSFFGYDWFIVILPTLEKWVIVITAFLFAFWYTFGIILDQLSGSFLAIFNFNDLLLKSKWATNKSQRFLVQSAVLTKMGKSSDILEYIKSRLRVIRATAINSTLIMISLIIFISKRCDELGCQSKSQFIFITVGVGMVVVLLTLLALISLEIGYAIHEKTIQQELNKLQRKSKTE